MSEKAKSKQTIDQLKRRFEKLNADKIRAGAQLEELSDISRSFSSRLATSSVLTTSTNSEPSGRRWRQRTNAGGQLIRNRWTRSMRSWKPSPPSMVTPTRMLETAPREQLDGTASQPDNCFPTGGADDFHETRTRCVTRRSRTPSKWEPSWRRPANTLSVAERVTAALETLSQQLFREVLGVV